ncbi:uncharacterized protein LOC143886041 [Tasmannia lanceolata]|uniref:uncharacterized protein LOC143886041 n=1 Tax=Tasmannia lanceolata TaxID=3420 RepID=UPI004064297C
MVFSPAMPEKPYHVRSISMPSTSHPLVYKVEEELNKLKTWKTTPKSSSRICIGLGELKDLYDCVEEFLQLPLTQQALHHHQQEKWVEEVLDGSLRLLDICGTTRDVLLQMKEHVKDLQSTLRRRKGGDSGMLSRVDAYICHRKKVKKEIGKCLESLKGMDNKYAASLLLDQDYHLSLVVNVLREVSTITKKNFGSILSFMSSSRPKQKPSKWSLVSKLMHKGQIICEGEHEVRSEVENADAALSALCSCCGEIEMVQMAKKRLEELEQRIGSLEDALECMFKRLIQTRVGLLNILTH